MLYPVVNNDRSVISLDGFWNFKTDAAGVGVKQGWEQGLSDTREVAVPASINEQYSDLFNFHGMCWYEKKFYLPKELCGKSVFLRFGSVTGKTTVWVNGENVAFHEGGTLPFCCDISQMISLGKENKIVILSDNTLDPWSLPPAAMQNNEGREGFFNSYPAVTYDFFPYSGIHRSVSLCIVNPVFINDVTINTKLDANKAVVQYDIELSKKVTAELFVAIGDNEVSHLLKNEIHVSGNIEITSPKIWDIGQPNLYSLDMILKIDGVSTDSFRQTFGIRTVEVKKDKLLLNGREIFLTGFGKHEDFHIFGKGFNHALVVKDFDLLKWIGANSFRTSHYPYDENILDYADRHGILVIGETPLVGLNERMYTEEILKKAKQLTQEMIARDKNHPSIIMWSLANEPNANSKNAERFFFELQKTARSCDSTRPITYVGYMEPQDNPCFKYFDIVCVNKYYGWYNDPGQLDVSIEELEAGLDAYYKAFKKPVIVTEFGADALCGLHHEPALMFSEEYQAEILSRQFEALKKKPFVIGAHVWAFADFMVTQSTARIIYNRKGVFTRERQPKLAAHCLKKLWRNDYEKIKK